MLLKIKRSIFITLLLLLSRQVFSQGSNGAIGPSCIQAGVQYTYNLFSNAGSFSYTVTGGSVIGLPNSGSSSTGNLNLTISWNAGGGTITVNSATGSGSFTAYTPTSPRPGSITSGNGQTINYNTIPDSIKCSLPIGGGCPTMTPTYLYQWLYSTDSINFSNLSGATSQNLGFNTPLLNTTFFRRKVTISETGNTANSVIAKIKVYPPLQTGNINPARQFINAGNRADSLSLPNLTGGSGVYSYQWQKSADSINWTVRPGDTTSRLKPDSVIGTWFYRVIVSSYGVSINSPAARVTMYPLLVLGNVHPLLQIINYRAFGATLSLDSITGGSGMYAYQWQSASDSTFSAPTNVPNAIYAAYTPTGLPAKTYYRLAVTDNGMTKYSAVAVVYTSSLLVAGAVSPTALTLAAGGDPGTLTSTPAGGGTGTYSYQWQSSADGISFTPIAGATSLTYLPGALSTSKYYRIKVASGTDSALSDLVLIRIGLSNTGLNYIQSWTVNRAGAIDSVTYSSLTDPAVLHQTTQYFDGLGRPIQTISRQASPQLRDMVTTTMYDSMGRPSTQYLPYTAGSFDGNYKTDPVTETNSFNTSQFPNELYYYGHTVYELSPLGRPLITYAAGNNWIGSNRGITSAYRINAVQDSVRIWDIQTTAGSRPVSTGRYPAGQLSKNGTTDEQGHQVVEYKNNEGLVIMKKVQLSDTPGTAHTGWLCTYYVYDIQNNLRFVISPKAVSLISSDTSWNITQSIADGLCFRYEYDSRNRMIIKKVPDAGETRMIYDKYDRLVMTQDSNLRVQKKWLFTRYDALNRPDSTGLMTDTGHYNDQTYHRNLASQGGIYPNLGAYTTVLLTSTFYDNYAAVSAASGLPAQMATLYTGNPNYFIVDYNSPPFYAVPVIASPMTMGLVTGTMTKVLDTSNRYLYTENFYDDRGRVVQTQSRNSTSGVDTVTTQYSFHGDVLRSLQATAKLSNTAQYHKVFTKKTYDPNFRVKNTYQQLDGSGTDQVINTLQYNELGQVQTRYLGSGIDSLVYDYNIRGWMTGINKNYVSGSTSHYFGVELGYDQANSITGTSYTHPQFNGNIGGLTWKSGGDGIQRKYDFTYDNVNRLTGASFLQNSGAGWNNSIVDYTVNNLRYDANGNILSMNQNGFKWNASSLIDSLAYSYYTTSNRLSQVRDGSNDSSSKLGDFHYKTLADTAYRYDGNGNLVKDFNKGIDTIIYNHLNLPQLVHIVGKGNISYTYDAAGNKLTKTTLDSLIHRASTTLYLDRFVYQRSDTITRPSGGVDTLQFLLHEEGRSRWALHHIQQNGTTRYGWEHDFFEKDHLRNIRIVLTTQKDTAQYIATMDSAYRAKEDSLFYNIPATSYPQSAVSGYPGSATSHDSVARVNGSGQKVGPAIILKVMSGDIVQLGTNYFFNASGATNGQHLSPQDLINSLATGIVSLAGGAHGSFTDLTGSTTPLTGALTSFINTQNGTTSGKPNAYLNWILLDNQCGYVGDGGQSGALQVANAGATPQGGLQSPLATTVTLKKSGYLYIYVSNATPNWDVFFDNLSVTHYSGPMLEETHYYPFGLTMAGISDKAFKSPYPENKYKFVGQLYDDDFGWDMYQFRYRDHDPQIGRFWQVDPLATKYPHNSTYAYAEDRPINGIDLEGLEWWSPLIALAENNSGPILENVVKTSAEVGNKASEVTEDHHLLPKQLKYDPVMRQARRAGFDYEGEDNLQEVSKYRKETGEGQHGNHPRYNKEIARRIAEIKKDNPKMSDDEAFQFAKNTADEMRDKITQNPDKKINDLFTNIMPINQSDATSTRKIDPKAPKIIIKIIKVGTPVPQQINL